MERRSFLRGLLLAPIAIPLAAKGAAEAPATSVTIKADRFCIGRLSLTGDMIADGAIMAKKLSLGDLTAISANLCPISAGTLRAR